MFKSRHPDHQTADRNIGGFFISCLFTDHYRLVPAVAAGVRLPFCYKVIDVSCMHVELQQLFCLPAETLSILIDIDDHRQGSRALISHLCEKLPSGIAEAQHPDVLRSANVISASGYSQHELHAQP